MRVVTLNAVSAGMTRLRSKGGANPETLYELTNGYVTASKTIKQRPAIRYQTKLPATSRGLCVFNGVFYTFTAHAVSNPGTATVKVLIHPTPGYSGELSRIHFAAPFMARLYVVAEFDDASVSHYWLSDPPAWTASTIYAANQLIQPTTPNGLYYQAQQTVSAATAWTAGLTHNQGDVIQPTVYNAYQYTAIETNGLAIGGGPANSGQVEPTWPTFPGATVLESSAGAPVMATPAPTPPPATPPGRGDGGRYTNPGGSGGRRGWANPTPRTP